MRNYKYKLETGSKHIICPNCGKKTFKCYVNADTGERVDPDKWGRCERILSCGYIRYPTTKPNEYRPPKTPVYIAPQPIDYVGNEIVERTFSDFKHNVFFQYLIRTFGKETAFDLQSQYNIGTTKTGGTIFWQQDRKGRFRTGKVIYYKPNGKRDHDKTSWFVHKKIRPDFNYQQCFFGLHLTTDSKPIALCESEKTAVMMSVYQPDFTWVASGGSEMLSTIRLAELPRLDKVFADNGQTEKWEKITRNFDGRIMDGTVDAMVSSGLLPAGSDVLDLTLELINQKKTNQ